MTLLSIWGAGALVPVISLIGLGLAGWFFYQTWKAHNSGTVRQKTRTEGGGYELSDKKMPITKIPQFWFGVVVLSLYVIAMLIIRSDYA